MTRSRERLLDALVAITAERGLDQVSIREVAAAADVSVGTVQYYCRSKDEMLRAAFEYVAERIIGRATNVEITGTVGDAVRSGLSELLPLDERRAVESRVYLAFAARAAVSPDLAEVQHRMLTELRDHLTRAYQRAVDVGEAPADLDPAAAGAATAALVDGLLLHLLTDPVGMSADAASSTLEAHLRCHLRLTDAPPPASGRAHRARPARRAK